MGAEGKWPYRTDKVLQAKIFKNFKKYIRNVPTILSKISMLQDWRVATFRWKIVSRPGEIYSYMDEIIILFNFIFTGLHGDQIMPGLSII